MSTQRKPYDFRGECYQYYCQLMSEMSGFLAEDIKSEMSETEKGRQYEGEESPLLRISDPWTCVFDFLKANEVLKFIFVNKNFYRITRLDYALFFGAKYDFIVSRIIKDATMIFRPLRSFIQHGKLKALEEAGQSQFDVQKLGMSKRV